eukprot:6491635-Amphidinium_carterae.2
MPSAPATSPRQRSETMCKFYLKGTCNKGSDCPFSHNKNRKTSREGRKRTPQRKGSRDRKDSGGKSSDRKRSGSGGKARQRKTSNDRKYKSKNNATPVTFRCHSSDDDNSSVDPCRGRERGQSLVGR